MTLLEALEAEDAGAYSLCELCAHAEEGSDEMGSWTRCGHRKANEHLSISQVRAEYGACKSRGLLWEPKP